MYSDSSGEDAPPAKADDVTMRAVRTAAMATE
jgi:hypothetical protein